MIIPQGNPLAQQAQFLDLFGPLDLHQPERRQLLDNIEALIVTRGTKTAKSLAQSEPDGPDRSGLCRHFDGSWDEQALLAAGRAMFLEQWRGQITSDLLIHHIVDDTANPHAPTRLCDPWLRPKSCMEAVDRHYNHMEGRCRWAHTVVTTHVVCANWSLPWREAIYRRQADCEHAGLVFKSKIELALELVADFTPPHPGQPVCHLVDSWYMNGLMLRTVRGRAGHLLIGAVVSKTSLTIAGQRAKLSHWARRLKPEDLELVKLGSTQYEVHRFEGRVFGQEEEVVVLATRAQGKTAWTFILCSQAGLATERIMAHYAVRWAIETGHWYLKCTLGFGDYRLRPLRAIQRFWAEVLVTYWYLEWLRHRLKLPTLADMERRVIREYDRWWAVRVWEKSRQCQTPEEVWATLGLAV